MIHYRLGKIYRYQKNWQLALKHYQFVASTKENISDDQLLAIVNTGEKQGVFEKREKTAIKNILEFTDT